MRHAGKKGIVEATVILFIVAAFLGGVLLWKPATSMLGISNTPRKIKQSMIKKEESKPVLYYTDEKGNKYVAYATKSEESSLDSSEEPKLTLWQKIKNLGVFGMLLVFVGLAWPPLGGILLIVWKRVSGTLKKAVENANSQLQNVQEEKDELSADAKKIVLGIDEGLAAFDSAIASAKGTADAAQQSLTLSSGIIDLQARAASLETAQHAYTVAQSVASAIIALKKDFMTAMSRKQDSTTKKLVAELKND